LSGRGCYERAGGCQALFARSSEYTDGSHIERHLRIGAQLRHFGGYVLILCLPAPRLAFCAGETIRYEVEETGDGKQALHAIKHSSIDILLLDLSMPRMDGFEVLDYLYEHRPGLPVIVMTGLDPDEIERHLTKMKRHDLPPMVLKPVDAPKLLALMEMALNRELPKFDGEAPADTVEPTKNSHAL
jgi:CheY-like chemotaxis protein